MGNGANMYWNYAVPTSIFHRSLTKEPQMAYVIALPCIGVKDTACVVVCPVDCIHPTKDEPRFAAVEQLYVDQEVCVDCGLCVEECPVKAIFHQDDIPSEWAHFVEINAAHYKK